MMLAGGGIIMQKSIFAALGLWSFCSPSYAEQSCEMISNIEAGNCQDGDIVKVSGTSASELPKIVQKYCDFDSQILTLADPLLAGLGVGRPDYIVLCKYHERKAAPRQ
ncbi:hypothetical protein [Mesorhizobium sp. M1273]|uniref:hypothetical protein n=1 Tax=Mesorhizobium sp. M1273 TaxID=2957075 RepID=UPI00333B8286